MGKFPQNWPVVARTLAWRGVEICHFGAAAFEPGQRDGHAGRGPVIWPGTGLIVPVTGK